MTTHVKLDAVRSAMIDRERHEIPHLKHPNINHGKGNIFYGKALTADGYNTNAYATQAMDIPQNHRLGYRFIIDRSKPDTNPAETIHTAPVTAMNIARPDHAPKIFGM